MPRTSGGGVVTVLPVEPAGCKRQDTWEMRQPPVLPHPHNPDGGQFSPSSRGTKLATVLLPAW